MVWVFPVTSLNALTNEGRKKGETRNRKIVKNSGKESKLFKGVHVDLKVLPNI